MTFATYGLSTSITNDERNDKTMQLRIGSVFVFGVDGVNILTGGTTDSDIWLDDKVDTSDSYAIESSFQWRGQGEAWNLSLNREHESKSDSETDFDADMTEVDALNKLIGGPSIHIVIIIGISSLEMRWDEPSHVAFHEIFSDLSSDFLYLDTPKLFLEQKTLCAQLSMNRASLKELESKSKYSAEINIHGITFECPCVEPSVPISRPVERQRGMSYGIHRSTRYIRVFVRSFKICGGDFLPKIQPYSKLEEKLHDIPTNSLWGSVDLLTEILLGKLKSSVVHPFVYSLNAMDIQLVTLNTGRSSSTDNLRSSSVSYLHGMPAQNSYETISQITKCPWSASCVISPCDVLAHPIFPAMRLDLFCSPLELRFSVQVSYFLIPKAIFLFQKLFSYHFFVDFAFNCAHY